jgi:hypothetical protein
MSEQEERDLARIILENQIAKIEKKILIVETNEELAFWYNEFENKKLALIELDLVGESNGRN